MSLQLPPTGKGRPTHRPTELRLNSHRANGISGESARTRFASLTSESVQTHAEANTMDERVPGSSPRAPRPISKTGANGSAVDSERFCHPAMFEQPKKSPLMALPSHISNRGRLRVRMSELMDPTDQMDSPADTESGAYHSAISFPGTPPFYFRGNESEETITTGGFRRKSNMVEELSIIHHFLDSDDEEPLLVQTKQKDTRPISGISQDTTRPPPSFATVVSGGILSLSLEEMCDLVTKHKSLQRARIVSAECYAEKLGVVMHRFVILELKREGRKDIYLRLDRRRERNISTLNFLAASGTSLSNDTAQLAARKDKLIGQAHRENRQLFETSPTLSQLEHLFRVVCEEIRTYTAWPANCWFFCSLIQQWLGTVNDGRFDEGSLKYTDLAPQVRERVYNRLQTLYPTELPRPPPPARQGTTSTLASSTVLSPSIVSWKPTLAKAPSLSMHTRADQRRPQRKQMSILCC